MPSCPRRSLALLTLLIPIFAACQWAGEHLFSSRTPCDYYLPVGYTGWASIEYSVPGAPALPVANGRYQLNFPQSGRLATSTSIETGQAHDRFFYRSRLGARELR